MQTHAGGELRNSQNKRGRRDPYMNSGGRAPADMGGEPPNGRAKGQRVLTSRPPEETPTPSVLAHVNVPA